MFICAVKICAVQDVYEPVHSSGAVYQRMYEDGDEQLIGATCDSDVGSGLADEVLIFTSVDSSGLQVDGVDGLVVGPGAGGQERTARAMTTCGPAAGHRS